MSGKSVISRAAVISAAFVALLITAGCFTASSSVSKPLLTPNALKENERTYSVQNMEIHTKEGTVVLSGKWYVVSRDFVIDYARMQDFIVKHYEESGSISRKVLKGAAISATIIAILMALIVIKYKSVGGR